MDQNIIPDHSDFPKSRRALLWVSFVALAVSHISFKSPEIKVGAFHVEFSPFWLLLGLLLVVLYFVYNFFQYCRIAWDDAEKLAQDEVLGSEASNQFGTVLEAQKQLEDSIQTTRDHFDSEVKEALMPLGNFTLTSSHENQGLILRRFDNIGTPREEDFRETLDLLTQIDQGIKHAYEGVQQHLENLEAIYQSFHELGEDVESADNRFEHTIALQSLYQSYNDLTKHLDDTISRKRRHLLSIQIVPPFVVAFLALTSVVWQLVCMM